MKKVPQLKIYLLILFSVIYCSKSFCQSQCITAVSSNNASEKYLSLSDSGDAVGQNFQPACNGNLTSFSFCYKVLQSDYFNKGVVFPTNSSGNPIFNVDLTIYELSAGQSLNLTDVSLLKSIYSQANIEVPIPTDNPRQDFQYITIPVSQTIGLSASKQYCFVIQLSAAFCNNLMVQKAAKIANNLTNLTSWGKNKQVGICTIQFSIRNISGYNCYIKHLGQSSIATDNNSFKASWWPAYSALTYAVNITPNLQDIQGNNIVCKNSTIALSYLNGTGTWAVDNSGNAIIPSNSTGSSVTVTGVKKGLTTITYTEGTNTTTKLIRVVEIENPTITASNTDLTVCQDNNFTLTGTATNNQALQLDSKSWAQVPNHPALGLTNKLTLEAWVYCADPAAPQYIISKGSNDQEMGQYGLALFNGNLEFHLQHFPGLILKSPIVFNNSVWRHVAATYDGDTMRLYIDGGQVSKLGVRVLLIPNNGNLYIGELGKTECDIMGTSLCLYRMKGQIDEVRIWNVCRTAQEIKDNMYKTVYANNTGLVGYYKFNEPASADARLVTDYSGSHNDGRLYSSSSGITIDVLPNCTATKVPASISFGDFSYSWSNNATQNSMKPANTGNYTYTIKDSATGCSATSDAIAVKMNATANITKTIATNEQMPYEFNENGVRITFNNADFTNNVVATKPFTSTPTDGTCSIVTTVTVTKADCPTDQKILSNDGQGKDIASLTWCGTIPSTLKIRGPENSTTISNQLWTVADPTIVSLAQSTSNEVDHPRVAFQTLTFVKVGNTSIKCTYTYQSQQGSITCSSTSNITVSPITANLSTTSNTLTNTASPTLTGTPAGGEWISSDYAKARMLGNTDNANSSTRTLQYIGAGSVNISYKITTNGSNTCLNPVIATQVITVQ